MAEGVVDDLEVVQIEEQNDRHQARRVRRLESLRDTLGEERAVGQACQRVVIGLVLELLLEPRQRAERLLQLAVLQGNCGMAGQRFEQLQVVTVEGTELAQPIGDDHDPHQAGLANERCVDRIPEAPPAGRPAYWIFAGNEEGPAFGHALHETVVGEDRPHRLHHRHGLARPDGGPQNFRAFLLGKQRDLRHLRPEHPAGMIEQRHQRPVDLRAALQDAGRLVEHLEAFVLLALGEVGPICHEDGRDRDGEQKGRSRLDEEDGDHEQGQARIGEGHDPTHHEHARNPAGLCHPLRQGDRGGDRENADKVLGRRRDEGRSPGMRTEADGCVVQNVDDAERDHRAKQELGQVEGQLDRSLAATEDKCQARSAEPRHDVLGGAQKKDAVDDRYLAHREGVSTAPDVQVDHLRFSHVEEDRKQVPRQSQRRLEEAPGSELQCRQARRNSNEDEGQQPHSSFARRRGHQPPGGAAARCLTQSAGQAWPALTSLLRAPP